MPRFTLRIGVICLIGFVEFYGADARGGDICDILVASCQPKSGASGDCYCGTPLGPIKGTLGPADLAQGKKSIDEYLKGIDLKKFQIQVYPKKTDVDALSDWKKLVTDITLTQGTPKSALKDEATNLVLFSDDVPAPVIRLLAASLITKGIKLKSIELYDPDQNPELTKRPNLLQIGSSLGNRDRKELTLEQVATSALPMFAPADKK